MDDLTKGLALDDRAEPTRANADGGLARPLPRGVEEVERDSLDTTVAAFPGTKPSADSELRLRLVDVDINDNQTTQKSTKLSQVSLWHHKDSFKRVSLRLQSRKMLANVGQGLPNVRKGIKVSCPTKSYVIYLKTVLPALIQYVFTIVNMDGKSTVT